MYGDGMIDEEVIEKGATLLETYHVESDAIKGGMGKVWRVRHTGWNVDLALKQPKQELFQSERQKESFIHECEAWINLGLHPHIVSCYYVREIGGIPSIFSEWMDGGSLKNWIYPGRLYEGDVQTVLERILDIAIQFARGLYYAHEQGLIHQDVKPDNLLLTAEWDAKVADFGIARARAVLSVDNIENADAAGGTIVSDAGGYTPAYCSPEQVEGGILTRRTDIYSWAVSVLEMFLGNRPWLSGAIAWEACEEYFAMDMRIDMPDDMKALLRECLKEDPDKRPYSFKEIDIALQQIYQAATGSVYPRAISKAAADTADSLNNRALSFLDLGMQENAEACWKKALVISAGHTECLYNMGVYLWSNARIDDTEAMRMLLENRSETTDYYLAKIHLARKDTESAINCLNEAKKVLGETGDIKKMIAAAGDTDENGEAGKRVRTFIGHTNGISSICISADGRTALTGSYDKTLKIWDIPTGKCIRTLEGHQTWVMSVSFSPDGKMAVSEGIDKALILWDVATGNMIRMLNKRKIKKNGSYFTDLGNTACFSPDGRTVISIYGNSLKLWDIKSGQCIRTFEGHANSITTVCFSPDGLRAVSGCIQNDMTLWNVQTGQAIDYSFMKYYVNSVCFSPDGSKVITGNSDKTLTLWDVSAGRLIDTHTLKRHSDDITSVCFSPDGKIAVSGSHDKALKMWDVASGRCVRSFELHYELIFSVCFSPDGRTVFSGNGTTLNQWALPVRLNTVFDMALCKVTASNKMLRNKDIFDSMAADLDSLIIQGDISAALNLLGKLAEVPQFGRSLEYYTIKESVARYCILDNLVDQKARILNGAWKTSISPDGRYVILIRAGTYELWDIAAGECSCTFNGHLKQITSFCFALGGKMTVLGYENKDLELWDNGTGQCVRTIKLHLVPSLVCVSPDGKMVFYQCNDKKLQLWDISAEKPIHVFKWPWPRFSIESIYFSNDGKKVVAAGFGLSLWDVETGKCALKEKSRTSIVCFSPDGKMVIFGHLDKKKLWNLATMKCIHIFEEKVWASSACFSPDGKTVIFGRWDTTLKLWDIAAERFICVFEGHINHVESVCFSPDGKMVISGSYDKTLKLWHVATGKCIHTFSGLHDIPRRIGFNKTGTKIITANESETIVFDLDYELTFPGWINWDDGALPYVQNFLALHHDYTKDDINGLIAELQCRGYGWLRPEGVQNKLDELQYGV